MSSYNVLSANGLLKETLQYLKREDGTVPGIGASRRSGELEGPEQRRFLLAENIEKFLSAPDPITEMLNDIKHALKTAGDFGGFDEDTREEDAGPFYPEQIAINILKQIAKRHGVEL